MVAIWRNDKFRDLMFARNMNAQSLLSELHTAPQHGEPIIRATTVCTQYEGVLCSSGPSVSEAVHIVEANANVRMGFSTWSTFPLLCYPR